MSVTHLRAAARTPQPWRNGGGRTFEIARRAAPPGSEREFLWRIGVASVGLPGPFSSFAGFERLIMVIDGAGMRLHGLGADDLELHPYAVCRFDGATPVAGLLPHGPVSDLNVIFDPLLCQARLTFIERSFPARRAACTDLLILNLGESPSTWTCDAEAIVLGRLDALWIDSSHSIIECCDVERAAMIEIEA